MSSPPRVRALLSGTALKRPSEGTIRAWPRRSALKFTRAASLATSRSDTTRSIDAYSAA